MIQLILKIPDYKLVWDSVSNFKKYSTNKKVSFVEAFFLDHTTLM